MEKLQAIYLSFLLNKYTLVTCFFLSGLGHNVFEDSEDSFWANAVVESTLYI